MHRIGRTARAGTKGVAVSFACENYSFSLPEIQAFIGQSIPLEMITDELLIKPKPPKRIEHDRVGSGPGGKGAKGGKGGSRDRGGRGRDSGSRSKRHSSDATRSRAQSGESKPIAKAESTSGESTSEKVANQPGKHTDDPAGVVATATNGDAAADPAKKPRKRRRRRKPAAADGESTNQTADQAGGSAKSETNASDNSE